MSYNSRYYTCEEIDERLLQGWYNDAVAAGYNNTREVFDKELALVLNEYQTNKKILKTTSDNADTWVKATFSTKEVTGGLEVTLNRNPHTPLKFIIPFTEEGGVQSGLLHPADLEQINNNANNIVDLQNQINKIVAGNTKLYVTTSQGDFFEGEAKSVTITARLSNGNGNIKIFRGKSPSGILVKTQPGVNSTTFTDTIKTTTFYYATAEVTGGTVNGNQVSSNAYYPIYSGAGVNADAVIAVPDNKHKTVKSNPYGEYRMVSKKDDFYYIIVPASMEKFDPQKVSFKKGGQLVPFKAPITKSIGGVNYNVYESQTKRIEGDYIIVVNR